MGFEQRLGLESGEAQQPDIAARYEQEVQTLIDSDRTVTLFNPDRFDQGKNRFLYGFTWPTETDQPVGFLKGARIEADNPESLHLQLAQESQALDIAGQLGIKAPRILNRYHEGKERTAYIHVEALNGENGFPLTSPELIAGAKPIYGQWAAETLSQSAGREIPPGTDTSAIQRTDERNASLEAFWQTWNDDAQIVLESLPTEKKNRFITLFEKIKTELRPLVESADSPIKNYLAHNDISPGNTHFDEKKKQALLLDFERASVAHNSVLAWITDVGNFYARAWPNPAMQREFLKTMMEKAKPEQFDQELIKLKAAVIFESNFLAKFAVDKEHPEHPMYVALLENMEENLNFLEQT